ncbi:MAG: hypothetical protein CMM16_02265 [Rhodospirillaceae bacterium]|nr:hypothetical protein [Rhodospirillaceae bacterium]|tara:strand:- start:53 stop:244 length:192 start_codon:yes stop_codon:yes gene_type:complete
MAVQRTGVKRGPEKPVKYITTEMTNLSDYGHNANYSLIGQYAAIAQLIWDTWAEPVITLEAVG